MMQRAVQNLLAHIIILDSTLDLTQHLLGGQVPLCAIATLLPCSQPHADYSAYVGLHPQVQRTTWQMIGQQVATLQKVLADSSAGTPLTRSNPTCCIHEVWLQRISGASNFVQLWTVLALPVSRRYLLSLHAGAAAGNLSPASSMTISSNGSPAASPSPDDSPRSVLASPRTPPAQQVSSSYAAHLARFSRPEPPAAAAGKPSAKQTHKRDPPPVYSASASRHRAQVSAGLWPCRLLQVFLPHVPVCLLLVEVLESAVART